MKKNNDLVSRLLGVQFSMEIVVSKRANETTETSEGLTVSFLVAIQGKQDNMKDIGISNSMLELNKTVIHQRQIPGRNWGEVRSPYQIVEWVVAVDTDEEKR